MRIALGGWSDGIAKSRNMWHQYSKASALETTGEGSFVCKNQRWRYRSKRIIYRKRQIARLN